MKSSYIFLKHYFAPLLLTVSFFSLIFLSYNYPIYIVARDLGYTTFTAKHIINVSLLIFISTLIPGFFLATYQITNFLLKKVQNVYGYILKMLMTLFIVCLFLFIPCKYIIYKYWGGGSISLEIQNVIPWQNIKLIILILTLLLTLIAILAIIFYKKLTLIKLKEILTVPTVKIVSDNNNIFNIVQISLFLIIISITYVLYKSADYSLFTRYLTVLFLFSYLSLSLSKFLGERSQRIMLLFIILAIIVIYSIFILSSKLFLLNDNFQFLQTIFYGSFYINVSSHIPSASFSRYAALFLKKYDWLTLTPYYHYRLAFFITNLSMFISTIVAFTFSMKIEKFNKGNKYIPYIFLFFVLLLPWLLFSYTTLMYSEVSILLMLGFFLLALSWADKSPSYLRYVIAVIPLALATYMKTPMFIFSLIMGFLFLIFAKQSKSSYYKFFGWLLLLNSFVYLAIYLYPTMLTLVSHKKFIYGGYAKVSIANVIKAINIKNIFHNIWTLNTTSGGLYFIFMAVAVTRVYFLIFKKTNKSKLMKADILLFSALCYDLFYVLLSLTNKTYVLFFYYHLPSLLLIMYSMGLYTQYFYNNYHNSKRRITLLSIITLIIVIFFITVSSIKRNIIYKMIDQVKIYEDSVFTTQVSNLVESSNINKSFYYVYISDSMRHNNNIETEISVAKHGPLNLIPIYINAKTHSNLDYKFKHIHDNTHFSKTLTSGSLLIIAYPSPEYYFYDKAPKKVLDFFIKSGFCSIGQLYYVNKYRIHGSVFFLYIVGDIPKVKYDIKPRLLGANVGCKK